MNTFSGSGACSDKHLFPCFLSHVTIYSCVCSTDFFFINMYPVSFRACRKFLSQVLNCFTCRSNNCHCNTTVEVFLNEVCHISCVVKVYVKHVYWDCTYVFLHIRGCLSELIVVKSQTLCLHAPQSQQQCSHVPVPH